MRLVAAIAIMAASLAPAADAARPAERAAVCERPGGWPHTRDADWLVQVLHRAGFRSHGCTGSAFTVDLGSRGGRGDDLYVWAVSAPRFAPEPGTRTRAVAGARVHLSRIRAGWRAGRRNVWVEAGPTTRTLPRVERWRRIVAASLALGH